jgi:hypothetical protein
MFKTKCASAIEHNAQLSQVPYELRQLENLKLTANEEAPHSHALVPLEVGIYIYMIIYFLASSTNNDLAYISLQIYVSN